MTRALAEGFEPTDVIALLQQVTHRLRRCTARLRAATRRDIPGRDTRLPQRHVPAVDHDIGESTKRKITSASAVDSPLKLSHRPAGQGRTPTMNNFQMPDRV
jgi:hypothetical protein